MLGVRNPLLEAVLKPGDGIVSKKNTAERLADKLESCQSAGTHQGRFGLFFGPKVITVISLCAAERDRTPAAAGFPSEKSAIGSRLRLATGRMQDHGCEE